MQDTDINLIQLVHESPDLVRQQWTNYKDQIKTNSPEFDLLWDRMCQRSRIYSDDQNALRFKQFIIDETETELVYYGLNARKRANMHLLCDKIGLVSASDGESRDRRLVVTRPRVWLWEYTVRSGNSDHRRLYCNECSIVGSKRDLLCSVHYGFLLCHECHDTKSDRHGDPYDSHKWEPMY